MNLYLYHKTQIAIYSDLLTLSTSYFQHITPHHFYMRKYNLVSCTSGVPTLRGLIPRGSNPPHLQVGVFESLHIRIVRRGYCFVLFFNFYPIRYGDTGV